jgi:hemolysin D
MNPADKIVSFPKNAVRRDSVESAFLPEALEIIETPPSPTGRLICGMIIAIFCLALVWACFGKIDIVASASGRIIATGKSKVVQPFETGVVHAINVKDGESVRAGQTLIELDRTISDAELEHLSADWIEAKLDIARLEAALADGAEPLKDFHPPVEASAGLIATQGLLLSGQVAEQRAKTAGLDRQRAQKEAERTTVAATIAKLEATIPIMTDRVTVHKTLYEHGNGSKLAYLESLEPLVEQQQDLIVQKSRLQEAEAAIAAAVAARSQTDAEFRRALSTELVEAERKAAGLAGDLAKARERTRLQSLTSPVDGVVQQLAIHTIGGVVTPAQQLMVIVPIEGGVEIEAEVGNRDIGYVRVGEQAEIKINTFDYTRYGLVRGHVVSLSHDALPELRRGETDDGDPQSARNNSERENGGAGPAYSAIVSLDQTDMDVDGERLALTPGMAVTVEFKTGARTLISYLLSPLFRYRHDSMREM